MKTESGSPIDLAGGLHRDDGEHDEDPKLRAMRSVWLEMRDEEPPERGLAELLAAARTKAATMQVRPTLWQRLVAGLARPPALALATVMILVGGAVLIGRRGVDVSVPAPSGLVATEAPSGGAVTPVNPAEPPAANPAEPPAANLAEPAGALEDTREEMPRERKAAGEGAAPAQALPEAEPADDRSATKAGPAGGRTAPSEAPVTPVKPAKNDLAVRPPAPPEASKKAKRADMAPPAKPRSAERALEQAPVVTASKDTGGFVDGIGEVPKPRVSSAPPPKPASNADSRGALSPPPARELAGASADATTTLDSERDEPPPPADAGESAKKAEHADTAKRPKAPAEPKASLEQLYKQCESAAQRGDCATVRSLVDRITKSDRGYRARVAKDSAVAKCLAE